MSKLEGTRIWKKGAEATVAASQEAGMNIDDFIEKSRVQARNYAQTYEKQAAVFISAGHRNIILEASDRLSAAKMIARNEPHFIPEIIEGVDQQAAFLIALAEELQKPEYNQ